MLTTAPTPMNRLQRRLSILEEVLELSMEELIEDVTAYLSSPNEVTLSDLVDSLEGGKDKAMEISNLKRSIDSAN
jgi:hypothetical protein